MIGTSILLIISFSIICLLIINLYELRTKNKLAEHIDGLGIAAIATILWFLLILILAANQEKSLELNSWGDFLAGFSAPILVIWLVYGIFLQKGEFGKVIESFEYQKHEFEKSVEAMRDQVVQVEVQQLNTWFNRNIQRINAIRETLIKTASAKVNHVDSIALIKEELLRDLTKHSDFFNIFDELKSILDMSFYIDDYLNELETENQGNQILIDSIASLKAEFKILYESELKDTKVIMTIVYFLIALFKNKQYSVYAQWLKDDSDIINTLLNTGHTDMNDALKTILPKIDSIDINFKTGKINGTV